MNSFRFVTVFIAEGFFSCIHHFQSNWRTCHVLLVFRWGSTFCSACFGFLRGQTILVLERIPFVSHILWLLWPHPVILLHSAECSWLLVSFIFAGCQWALYLLLYFPWCNLQMLFWVYPLVLTSFKPLAFSCSMIFMLFTWVYSFKVFFHCFYDVEVFYWTLMFTCS